MSVGTPDFTSGVVNAQKLIGSFGPAVNNPRVAVPPNAETLVVLIPGAGNAAVCTAVGATTDTFYPATRVGAQGVQNNQATFFIDVSASVDSLVTVEISPNAPGDWYVYADAGTHLVADIGGVVDSQGKHFVIPTIPAGTSFDHPPNELLLASGNATGSGAVINALGAAWRIRIFALQMQCNNSGSLISLNNGNGGPGLLTVFGGTASSLLLPAQGFPLTQNTPLWANVPAFGAYWSAYFTHELV